MLPLQNRVHSVGYLCFAFTGIEPYGDIIISYFSQFCSTTLYEPRAQVHSKSDGIQLLTVMEQRGLLALLRCFILFYSLCHFRFFQ